MAKTKPGKAEKTPKSSPISDAPTTGKVHCS